MPIPSDDHLHRQMPGSPFVDMNARVPRDPRMTSPHFESRLAMEHPYCFPAVDSRSRGTFPPGFEPDSMMSGPEQYMDELVRR